jgi:hypothetical protein
LPRPVGRLAIGVASGRFSPGFNSTVLHPFESEKAEYELEFIEPPGVWARAIDTPTPNADSDTRSVFIACSSDLRAEVGRKQGISAVAPDR